MKNSIFGLLLFLSTPTLFATEFKNLGIFAAGVHQSSGENNGLEVGGYDMNGFWSSYSILKRNNKIEGPSNIQTRFYIGIGAGEAPFLLTIGPNFIFDQGLHTMLRGVVAMKLKQIIIAVSAQNSFGYGKETALIIGYTF